MCTVHTSLLPEYESGKDEPWSFDQRTDAIVRGYMNQFTQKKTPQSIIAELRGAGIKFFEAAPSVFKDAFWALIDLKKPFKTISIVSQEPFVPWELMIPSRDGFHGMSYVGISEYGSSAVGISSWHGDLPTLHAHN
jgi:hypothetical protein